MWNVIWEREKQTIMLAFLMHYHTNSDRTALVPRRQFVEYKNTAPSLALSWQSLDKTPTKAEDCLEKKHSSISHLHSALKKME